MVEKSAGDEKEGIVRDKLKDIYFRLRTLFADIKAVAIPS